MALVACLGISSVAHASPSVNLLYENNNALKQEGVNTQVAYTYKDIEAGVNAFADSDKLHSYGVFVGLPFSFSKNGSVVSTYTGLNKYRALDQTVGTFGVGYKYPFTKKTYIDARVHYAIGINTKDDRVEDVVYNIGLSKKF